MSLLFLFLLSEMLSGQSDSLLQIADSVPEQLYVLNRVERNGEILPEAEIREVTILGRESGRSARRNRSLLKRYERHIYNLNRVYPYAIVVRERLYKANYDLEWLKDDRERKRYIKDLEKDVFAEYEDDMKKLTLTQGKLLIKLVDRETQITSFQLIKDYRGGFSAIFWQGIARIFGTNLKAEYDPYGEDALTEAILRDIEAGLL